VVNTLSQRPGGGIQIPKRPAPAKRLSSTGLNLKGRQGYRRAVLFAGPPDTTFFIFDDTPVQKLFDCQGRQIRLDWFNLVEMVKE
jgi:hypothetical protein